MIFIFTIFIVIPLFYFALSKRTEYYVNLYGLGLNLMPIIQMLLYPAYKLEGHYRDVVIAKVIFDLIFLLTIIIFLLVKNNIRINKTLTFLLLAYLTLNIPSVIYSSDVSKSALIYVVAILTPISFGILLYNSTKSYSEILNYIFNWIGISLIVKYVSIVLNGLRTGFWNFSYGAYDFSVIRGNSIVTALAIFIPLFIVTLWNKNNPKKWRIISILSLVALITSGSRMGLFCLAVAIVINYKMFSVYRIVLFGMLLFVLNGIYTVSSTSSLLEFFVSRFTERGSLINNATEDGRVFIWTSTLDLFSERNSKLLGLGMFSDYSIYSNAHNLYLNQWVERGLFGVLSIIILFIHFLRRSWKHYDIRWMLVGTLLLAVASITGEDFFTISRVVHGYGFYFLIYLLIALYKHAPSREYR